MYKMVIYLNNWIYEFYKEYTFALLIFNLLIYIFLLLNFFLIFFLFDTKYFKTLNEFKYIGNLNSISINIVLILMSFAGVPPLLGFSGKFIIFIFLVNKTNFLFLTFFSLLNIFLIYFYIQNFRFLVPKETYSKIFFNRNFNFSKSIIIILMVFNFFNILGIMYIEDFLNYCNFISSNMFL